MIAVEGTVLALLAAGRGERYGDIASKLDEDFLGRPLGLHVAVTLESIPFKARIAVTGRSMLDYAAHGFRILPNDDPGLGMARSIRIAVACAKEQGADAVLIALADMPRVTGAHIHRLFDASTGPASVVASSDGCDPKPPALFGRDQFDCLLKLEGAEGARDLVRGGRHVVTAPAELIDIDTPEDLDRLRALIRSPEAVTRGTARRAP